MSFILDALRKSEHERQRQTGPGISDWRAATVPRPAFPIWAMALAALLAVNLVIVLILVIRGDFREPASIAQASGTDIPPKPISHSQSPPSQNPTAPAAIPAVIASDASAQETLPSARPLEAVTPPAPPTEPPSAAAFPEPQLHTSAAARMRDDEMLPTLNDVTLSGRDVPKEMHLDIHVYGKRPVERFVYINNRKYVEGEQTAEGTSIERITPDGVVLSHRGTRFLLPRQ